MFQARHNNEEDSKMRKDLEQFKTQPEAFWKERYDGYDLIEYAHEKSWHAIPDWGEDGELLGDWPLAIVFFRTRPGRYEIACYREGEIEVYTCPSREIRKQITDELASQLRQW